MRAGKINRVKRQLLRQAVADNLDTIRGLPPRNVRPVRRIVRLWLRRAPLVLLPFVIAGSTYLTIAGSPTAPPRMEPPKPFAFTAPRPTRIAAANAAMPESLEPLSASALPLSVRRVVIDAGHGGTDPGASALSQLTEKEITLDIARRLRTVLQKNGFDVVVTRGDDRLIPLRERARLANSSEGDIFVSIHVNSVANRDSHGIETYYLGPTNDPTLTELAAAENRTSGYSLTDLHRLLDGIYADVRRDESHRLAASVQEKLFDGLRVADPGLRNWGVKRAPFIVLVATEMPAVLAEVGCLSNDREAEMLRRPDYRERIAGALFAGIRSYSIQR